MRPLVPYEVIKESAEFSCLSQQQKMAIATYLNNGYNIVHAVRTAYECKNDREARIRSYSIFRSKKILAVLTLHFGDTNLCTTEGDGRYELIRFLANAMFTGGVKQKTINRLNEMAQERGWITTPVLEAASVYRKAMRLSDGTIKTRINRVLRSMTTPFVIKLFREKPEPETIVVDGFEMDAPHPKRGPKAVPTWDLSDFENS